MAITPVVDTRIGIWEKIFKCGIRYIDLMREEEIRLLGLPTTGDPTLDRSMMHNVQDTWLTINEMIEYYRRGIEIRIRNYDDTKRIYDYIQAHLKAWQRDILNSHTTRHAPLDDLIDLDRFANLVYDKAKYLFNANATQSEFIEGLERSLNFVSLFNIPQETPSRDTEGKDPYPKRESFEKLFTERVHPRTGYGF